MTNYCTLADVRTERKTDSTDISDDAQLRRYIAQVSHRIDSTMGTRMRPYFAPYLETRQYLITSRDVDSYRNTLTMRDYCLALTAVVRGSTTITSSTELYTPYNNVAQALRITNWSSSWYDDLAGNDIPPAFVQVTAYWGWHEDYSNAWAAVDTVKDGAGINATVATITVDNADGADLDGFTPRFSPGNLIKIDDEFMDVTATDTALNTLTVRRARNGTTAAAHLVNAPISVYQVDERVRRIATRQAALLYSRQGAFQVESLDGVGVVTYPQDLLVELRGVLTEFQYG